ncbi:MULTISPECIES: AAA family ATPase [Rhizobiaceae]|uniref:AAA family ATPase n=1 Tax=Rhizobiaceae TaxID=82115 RepID=UPI000437A6C4|nr:MULTISPECIES: AAA family ATPase [Rhizobiaceae]EYR79534.1 ATPases involved in chromosome partitioning [Shinella sp. DD12]QSZ60824.1 ParA family protein [Rhizobium sp. ZX09]
MRIITLVTQKGGTGKTTIATSLAVAAHDAGEKVLALDLDPQGSLNAWGNLREADFPHVELVPANIVADLPKLLEGVKAQGFTLTILDTAGADNPTTHLAMQAADLCLVPLRPTSIDGNAVMPTTQALQRLSKPFAFVLSQCSTIPRNSRAAEMAAGLRTLGVLAEPFICQRADYQDAYAAGQGVTERDPNGKAAQEMRDLWQWANKRMKGKSA